jgi:hypothetical protein
MKQLLTITVFTVLFIIAGTSREASGQKRYVDHSTEEGVSIQYRWANSKWLDKSSPLELRLKIKNNNDYPVEISYVIDFYMGPVHEESSDVTELCISPKLAKTGRINGMYYQSSRLSNQQLESDAFSWEIRDLEIDSVESCR